MDQLKILDIIEKNKDKDFVNRIINAKDFPVLTNRDGSVSTHGMSWGEADGRFFVYPTVVYDEDQMTRLGPDTAFGRAIRSGDYIEFADPQSAMEFSKEYKKFSPFFGEAGIKPDVIYPKRKSIWKDMNTGPGTLSTDNLGD